MGGGARSLEFPPPRNRPSASNRSGPAVILVQGGKGGEARVPGIAWAATIFVLLIAGLVYVAIGDGEIEYLDPVQNATCILDGRVVGTVSDSSKPFIIPAKRGTHTLEVRYPNGERFQRRVRVNSFEHTPVREAPRSEGLHSDLGTSHSTETIPLPSDAIVVSLGNAVLDAVLPEPPEQLLGRSFVCQISKLRSGIPRVLDIGFSSLEISYSYKKTNSLRDRLSDGSFLYRESGVASQIEVAGFGGGKSISDGTAFVENVPDGTNSYRSFGVKSDIVDATCLRSMTGNEPDDCEVSIQVQPGEQRNKYIGTCLTDDFVAPDD